MRAFGPAAYVEPYAVNYERSDERERHTIRPLMSELCTRSIPETLLGEIP